MSEFQEILRKSWAAYDAKHHGQYPTEAHRTAARWADYYAPHVVPSHGLKVGDRVLHTPTGRKGTVALAHSSGFITVNHGDDKNGDLEDYHHSELQKIPQGTLLGKEEKVNNWAKWDAEHAGIKSKAKEIFVGFKGREGMKPEHAASEFDRIHSAGSKDAYISATRIGAPFTQNRKEKLSNVGTFENAYNHAGFAMTHKQEFSSILKGTEGKHWHWHDHKGSQIATAKGAGYKSSHTSFVSRFVKNNKSHAGAEADANSLHNHLTSNGFNLDSTESESHPWRDATQMNYSHPDGTKVISMLNKAKDDSTETAHGFSVYHADAKPAATPAVTTPESHAPEQVQGLNHPTNHMDVAKTIMQQYGGNKFRAMTGANNFTASPEKGGALTFKLPRTNGATKGTKYVKTVYDPASDTYDVHMLGTKGNVKHSATGVYADQLQDHFKHHTGLDTHL